MCGALVLELTPEHICGKLVEDPRIEAQESMLEDYQSLKKMYAAGDGHNQVLYLTDATATFSGPGQEPRTVTF